MNDRVVFIDLLKAIGIFFVFLGHAPGLNHNLVIYIYSFHMPLFFFVAGMFFKTEHLTEGFKKYLIRKIRDRLIPYFFFGIITYVVWFAQGHIGVKNVRDHFKPLLGMLYGNPVNGWLAHNYVLWFLACLFSTEILFFILRKHFVKRATLIIAAIIISINGYMISYSLPFCLDISFIAIIFYCCGYVLRDFMLNAKINNLVVLMILISGIYLSYINGRVDMSTKQYGNYLFFTIAAFSSIIFWLQISKKIPALKILKYIGENSILFFLLHTISTSVTYFLIYKVLDQQINNPDTLFAIMFSIAGLIILLPVSYVMKKYLPSILIGKSYKNSFIAVK
jgi:fucose 4-O-acetylase-like acetyltransferase